MHLVNQIVCTMYFALCMTFCIFNALVCTTGISAPRPRVRRFAGLRATSEATTIGGMAYEVLGVNTKSVSGSCGVPEYIHSLK